MNQKHYYFKLTVNNIVLFLWIDYRLKVLIEFLIMDQKFCVQYLVN